jgi:hypothetical protein
VIDVDQKYADGSPSIAAIGRGESTIEGMALGQARERRSRRAPPIVQRIADRVQLVSTDEARLQFARVIALANSPADFRSAAFDGRQRRGRWHR